MYDEQANANKRQAVEAFDAMPDAAATDEIFSLLETAHEALTGNNRVLRRWLDENR